MAKKPRPKEFKTPVPGWMVSFGDMMTLILTFFILLVSMAQERSVGLAARGIGSFVVAANSYGMGGVLSGAEKKQIFNEVRVRFNLPPVENPMDPDATRRMATSELVRAEDIENLTPRDELFQPSIALFDHGSSTLDAEATEYLDLLAPSLRPRGTQVLVLEAQAGADEAPDKLARQRLGLDRTRAVREHLETKHDFARARMETRVWLAGLDPGPNARAAVDARLILGAK